ncbi:hypothetical protein [Streptomyces sp. NPDC051776]|uniref:hypothetical protein n=1 Tax=Streptomyces sp. NPDC051776 TaxID=3155414 RepID=UPI00343792A5
MRGHRIATATMVVLVVSGWAGLGHGAAFAETGPDGTKARATGGSSTGGEVFQQNTAQSSRQNNHCNNPNMQEGDVVLSGSRAAGRCVSSDESLTAFSRVRAGHADVEGGSSSASLGQQNTSQRGRQNNICNNPNDPLVDVDGGRVEGRCADQDRSFSKYTHVSGGGVRAEGGSSTSLNTFQQNAAQEGRQNNHCNNPKGFSNITVTGGRLGVRCGNEDGSLSKHTHVKGGGARADGGSSTEAFVFQQNTAQEGRQNNHCSNPNVLSDLAVTGGRMEDRCMQQDFSFSKHALVKGDGARAEGGSSTITSVIQQNTAQEGRQNNHCNVRNRTDITVTGGRAVAHCGNKDGSFSKHTHVKGGGAHAEGGFATGVDEQNVAQEGRQNNNCNSPNGSGLTVDGGRSEDRCTQQDFSFSKHTHVKGDGARAEGGSTGGDVSQQNAAQEGRQNNYCNNLGTTPIALMGSQAEARCGNKDHSFSKHTHLKGGGARAEGGSTTGSVIEQQNVAQEGRQNNSCNNPNAFSSFFVPGGRVGARCANKDDSFSKHTHVKGGGARVEGGSATVADMRQQNIAQEGRQNNNCNNPNLSSITLTGGRVGARCGNKDASFNKGTLVKGGGARAEGGSTTGSDMFQQNVAQEGRQNNNCNNPNNSPVTVTGGRAAALCGNQDHSFSKHTHLKGGGARAEGGSTTGGGIFQQNTAQEGRQNNNCNNPNNLTLTAAGSDRTYQCRTVDNSRTIGTIYQ